MRSRRRAAGVVLLLVVGLLALWGASRFGGADAAPGPDACGKRIAKPGGGWWRCSFHDDFTGSTLNARNWVALTGQASGTDAARGCQSDAAQNVSVAEGALRLSVRPVAPFTCQGRPASYTTATVATHRLFSQTYGRFEARIRAPEVGGSGLQEAFWLWPDDRVASTAVWPAAGEIDIAETYSHQPGLVIPFLHYTANDNGGPVTGLNTAYCAGSRGEWHTYALVWSAERITISVDGEPCLANSSADPAFAKPYIVALSAMLGVRENAYDGVANLAATTEVDYVRVWH